MMVLPKLGTRAEPLERVAFHPHARYFATGSARTLTVWDVTLPQPAARFVLPYGSTLSSLAFTPDGALLLAAIGWDNTIAWDWAAPAERTIRWFLPWTEFRLNRAGTHAATIGSEVSYRSFPANQLLWRQSYSDRPTLTDLTVAHEIIVHPHGALVAFTITEALADHNAYQFHLLDAATGARVQVVRGFNTANRQMAWSPDGNLIVVTAATYLHLFDVERRTFFIPSEFVTSPFRSTFHFTAVAFTTTGALLAGANNGVVRCWPRGYVLERPAWDWQRGAIRDLAVASDGLRAAVATASGAAVIWDLDE